MKKKMKLEEKIIWLFRLGIIAMIIGGLCVLMSMLLDYPVNQQQRRNVAWTALVEKPNDEVRQVADDLELLLLGTGGAPEDRFVSLLNLYDVHYEASQPYSWYWLALSGNEGKTSQATRNLLFNDLDFADRFSSLKTLIVNPNLVSTDSQLGRFIDIYVSDQDTLELVLVGKADLTQLVVEVEYSWKWLELLGYCMIGFAFFLLILGVILILVDSGTIFSIFSNVKSFLVGYLTARNQNQRVIELKTANRYGHFIITERF